MWCTPFLKLKYPDIFVTMICEPEQEFMQMGFNGCAVHWIVDWICECDHYFHQVPGITHEEFTATTGSEGIFFDHAALATLLFNVSWNLV